MTVSVQTPFASYVAAGSPTFVYGFRILDAAHLVVKANGVLQVLGVDYTVAGAGLSAGGTVVFTVAPSVGVVVTIQRKTPFARTTDYQNNGDLLTPVVNADFDACWLALQDAQFTGSLAVLLTAGDTAAPMTLPSVALRANGFLAFNALGQAVAAAGVTGLPATSFIAPFLLTTTAAAALAAIGAAAAGANADITALNALASVPAVIAAAIPAATPPVRQTVLSGPVDSNGFSAFGGSVGSATLTAAATLKATVAAGGDANYTGTIVNPAFTSPAGSGTGYLMLAINSAGVVTASVRTLAPVYQWGGTYSTTNGQFTFNIQEMTAKVGNGSVANQVFEVCIGECPYTAGVWSGTIVWYALMGRYFAEVAMPGSATQTSFNHNLGVDFDVSVSAVGRCLTAERGWSVGDIASILAHHNTGTYVLQGPPSGLTGRNSCVFQTGPTGTGVIGRTSGDITGALTPANWKLRMKVKREW